MAWIALISSLLVLWFASLCKVFLDSFSPSKAAFLDNGVSSRRRNILLVIAHPDDESMFFAPVINYLTSRRHNLHILCMSTGNADGMGNVRKEELYLASAVLKIPTQQVTILDHPDLQDGFGKVWNGNLLASIIDKETRTHSIDLIITFDNYGISGHCNHRDVHQGVRKLLHGAHGEHLEAWEIVSPNIVRKYIGPVDIWLSILFSRLNNDGQSYCLLNSDVPTSYAAMAQHSSQWVWFRKLFVTFSSCTFVSTLKKIDLGVGYKLDRVVILDAREVEKVCSLNVDRKLANKNSYRMVLSVVICKLWKERNSQRFKDATNGIERCGI